MKTKSQLLQDVLHDESYGTFRDEIFAASMRELRQRKRVRQRNRVAGVAICLVLAASLPWILQRSHTPSLPQDAPSYIVHSRPLSPDQIIRTGRLETEIVRTKPGTAESVLAQLGVNLIRTDRANATLELLNDEQLLAMFPGRPVGLIELANGKKQLFSPDVDLQMEFEVKSSEGDRVVPQN